MSHDIANRGEILLYSDENGREFVNVIFKDETFWLTQKAMSELFDCTTDNISRHLKNIFTDGELDKDSVTEKFSVTAADGKNYQTQHYNLDELLERIREIRASERRAYQKTVASESARYHVYRLCRTDG